MCVCTTNDRRHVQTAIMATDTVIMVVNRDDDDNDDFAPIISWRLRLVVIWTQRMARRHASANLVVVLVVVHRPTDRPRSSAVPHHRRRRLCHQPHGPRLDFPQVHVSFNFMLALIRAMSRKTTIMESKVLEEIKNKKKTDHLIGLSEVAGTRLELMTFGL